MKVLIHVVAILINLIFASQFLKKSFRLKKQIRKHSYLHQSLRDVDKENQRIFSILGLIFSFDALIIGYSYYEANY